LGNLINWRTKISRKRRDQNEFSRFIHTTLLKEHRKPMEYRLEKRKKKKEKRIEHQL
jgi:hypothetical protein